MRPGWLNVPAAQREPRSDPLPDDLQGGISCRTQVSPEPAQLALDRSDISFETHRHRPAPRPSCLSLGKSPRTHLVLVVVDFDSDSRMPESTAEAFVRSGVRRSLRGPRDMVDPGGGADVPIELVRLRGPEPASGSVAGHCRWCGADDGLGCWTDGMDKHRLDLALSAGRHAAERAKLAGVECLVGFAPLLDSETGRDLPSRAGFGKAAASSPHCCVWSLRTDVSRRDPYAVLSCPGLPEIAALVGVAIAGAQMGVSICLPGPAGQVVSHLAVLLNHGVSAWLDPTPFCMGAIQQARIVHRTMSSR